MGFTYFIVFRFQPNAWRELFVTSTQNSQIQNIDNTLWHICPTTQQLITYCMTHMSNQSGINHRQHTVWHICPNIQKSIADNTLCVKYTWRTNHNATKYILVKQNIAYYATRHIELLVLVPYSLDQLSVLRWLPLFFDSFLIPTSWLHWPCCSFLCGNNVIDLFESSMEEYVECRQYLFSFSDNCFFYVPQCSFNPVVNHHSQSVSLCGTMSHCVLYNIFKMKVEQLWTCTMMISVN